MRLQLLDVHTNRRTESGMVGTLKDMKMVGEIQDRTILMVLAMIHRAVLVTLIPIV